MFFSRHDGLDKGRERGPLCPALIMANKNIHFSVDLSIRRREGFYFVLSLGAKEAMSLALMDASFLSWYISKLPHCRLVLQWSTVSHIFYVKCALCNGVCLLYGKIQTRELSVKLYHGKSSGRFMVRSNLPSGWTLPEVRARLHTSSVSNYIQISSNS